MNVTVVQTCVITICNSVKKDEMRSVKTQRMLDLEVNRISAYLDAVQHTSIETVKKKIAFLLAFGWLSHPRWC